MSEPTPTDAQRTVIDDHDGITVVDAGAGTGKTFTITQRYASLLERPGVEPEDVLLVTFTNSAADEAASRIARTASIPPRELRRAPIGTFHSIARELLVDHGETAPTLLGIDERITASTAILEDRILEEDRFRSFYRTFVAEHPEHAELTTLVRDPITVLDLLTKVQAKGVVPTAAGWYGRGRETLLGDREQFMALFETANEPNEGARGKTQSDLRSHLGEYGREHTFPPSAPSKEAVRGPRGSVQIESHWAERAFDADRSALIAFLHDCYHDYLRFALERNYVTFGLLQVLAYVLLSEDVTLRESVRHSHAIVDEFQDTSALQFKLLLLLVGAPNLCVVGDWKQSVYGFQYAEVANIRSFEARIKAYKAALNADEERVGYPVSDVQRISLRRNFRSTQAILDLAEETLTYPATSDEAPRVPVDGSVASLEATTDWDGTAIESYTFDEQVDGVLALVRRIVGNDRYAVRDGTGGQRPPEHRDIAILTRKRKFGREVRARAAEVGVPVAYQGGASVFGMKQGVLVLAWLRIVADIEAERGWAVVLEEAGYRIDEINELLDGSAYPPAFQTFRDRLASLETSEAIARTVLDRYGYDGGVAEAIVAAIDTVVSASSRNRGGVIRYIVSCIEEGAVHEVTEAPTDDAVTVQTIHGAKGLEYPVVILADISADRFPSTQGSRGAIRYEEPIGARCAKLVDDPHGQPYRYDNWRYRILGATLRGEYDEERRLFYVAATRAQDHLFLTAGESPSRFFTSLPIEPETFDSTLSVESPDASADTTLTVPAPAGDAPAQLTAHDLIDDAVFETVAAGRGTAFGEQIHAFAEGYIETGEGDPGETTDKQHVRSVVDSLEGDLRSEVPVTLPLEIDGSAVTITGTADLLVETADTIHIIDFKTDRSDQAASEYRKQLSVYYHAVAAARPDHDVRMSIHFTRKATLNEQLPLTLEQLETEIRSSLSA